MKKIIIILIVIFLLVICVVSYIVKNMPYEKNYFKKLGISNDGVGYKYEDMIKDYGKPIREENLEDGWKKAIYNDFIIKFQPEFDGLYLTSIVITGDKYKFGRNKVGVGSTKEEILKAYKNVQISYDAPCTYLDNDIYVRFYFDDNNRIYQMLFFLY